MEAHLPHDPATRETTFPNHHAPLATVADNGHSRMPVHYSSHTSRNVTVFAAVIAVALLVAFFVVHHFHSNNASALETATDQAIGRPVPVDVVRVQRASAEGLLNLPGDARSFYETTLFGRTNGYIRKWLVDIGDGVKENQVLAEIETPELDDQLRETKANFAQLKAQANVAATNAQFAKVSYDRWEAAAPEGAVSQQERDEKKAELDSANAKLEAAKADINLGEAQVQRLQTLEKFKEVVAPFDGVITQRFIDIGSLVTAGSTTNTTPLYTISQSDKMRVFVEVPQPVMEDIHKGMQATVIARELPGQTFTGEVDRTALALDPKSRTMKVEVLVPNPKLLLLPGMYVEVSFETSRTNAPLRVPAAAMNFGPSGAQVAVVGKDQRITFRPVTIGRDMGDSVEISSGLSDNDMVALNVGSQVASGDQVEAHVIEMAAPPAPVRKMIPHGPVTAAVPPTTGGTPAR
ncbi:MAG TPA: efflux RND transporter periplasmic adaptor subunit [Tepidisphaeraceae bacterium]|jgi:RND family efflux transporter MFP subunit|nr:efflux RND transporter periplasmic adaptor subunit [Tepidisphaeraceae bacterium]